MLSQRKHGEYRWRRGGLRFIMYFLFCVQTVPATFSFPLPVLCTFIFREEASESFMEERQMQTLPPPPHPFFYKRSCRNTHSDEPGDIVHQCAHSLKINLENEKNKHPGHPERDGDILLNLAHRCKTKQWCVTDRHRDIRGKSQFSGVWTTGQCCFCFSFSLDALLLCACVWKSGWEIIRFLWGNFCSHWLKSAERLQIKHRRPF